MKKMLLLLVMSISVAYAQQSKLISTRNYLETGELDNAKDAINLAKENEETKFLAKTWYYRGIVYHAIYETKEEKYKALHTNPLNEAYFSYMKALEFDTKKIDIDDLNMRLQIAETQLLNLGVKEYNNNAFSKALVCFENSINIGKHFNTIDTLALYNAALSAENIGDNEKAITYYQQCIDAKYGGAKIYTFLSSLYKKEKNNEKAHEVIKKGVEVYPNNQNLIIELLNYYLEKDMFQEAKDALQHAIGNDPKDATLYYSSGTVYDKLKDFTQAETDYKKAIELQPDYFDAIYNLAALYYNQGVELNNLANNISDNIKFKEEKKQADEKFMQALPYFEKAHSINPDDKSTLLSLKQLYERNGDTVKFEQISKKLEK